MKQDVSASRRHAGRADLSVAGITITRTAALLPALLLFASGSAALIYQLLWVKQLSLVVGADLHAVTAAVSAFFAGMAIGSYVFGKRADILVQPLRAYAILEIGIAVLG